MAKPITVTFNDPNLPTPVVIEIPRSYIQRRKLDAVCAYVGRALDEYLLRAGWDTKQKPKPVLPNARTLFGHPIRAETTAVFHPDPLTLDAFESFMAGGARGYVTNMRVQPTEWNQTVHYIEEWVESWLAWSEVETE